MTMNKNLYTGFSEVCPPPNLQWKRTGTRSLSQRDPNLPLGRGFPTTPHSILSLLWAIFTCILDVEQLRNEGAVVGIFLVFINLGESTEHSV